MRVRRIFVRQDEVFTGKRYELETDQASPNNVIHLNPRLDKKAYEQAVALCPKIADLTWNDQTKRSVVLVNYWTVNYKTEMRATGKVGIRGLFVATNIVETDKSTAETPPIIPDTAAATETMKAYEAAQKAKETTVTDLNDELTAVANEQAAQDTPVHFSQLDGFWKKVAKRFQARKESAMIPSYMDACHNWFECESFTELKMTEDAFFAMLDEELKVRFDGKAQTPTKPKSDEKQNNTQDAPILNDNTPAGPDTPSTQSSGIPADVPSSERVIESEVIEPPKPQSQIALVPNTGLATMPMVAQWDIMKQQAAVLLKSGFLPQSIKTAEQAITIMMMGSALQIDPIIALNNINVIQGKPTVAPQLMLALVRRSGQLESFKVTDDGQCCTVEIKRKGEPMHTEKFSQSDAGAMGLSGKDNWRKQPAVMRKWRAIAAACRTVFSDIIWGIAAYTPEEIDPDIIIEDAA